MGFLDKLKGFAQSTQTAVSDEIGKFRNADALDALIGASVMIAAADGNISGDEKSKLLGFLKNTALTKSYSTDKVIAVFNSHADRFSFDAEVGRSEALRIIGKQRANVETARAIARLCVMIGKADGEFDADEQRAATQIINELGLNPSEFL
jgi:tellurite resistance protein TerB